MRAGLLRHSILLQSPPGTQDAAGQPSLSWTDFATVRGDIRYLNGLEAIKSNEAVSLARASIRIRYLTGVNAGMRATCNGVTFDIKTCLPDMTGRRFIDLACETGANNG